MPNMKGLVMVLLLCFPDCFADINSFYYYPPIYWHRNDCRFQSLKQMKGDNATKEVYMNVVYRYPYAPFGVMGLQIYCPTIHMNNWMEDSPYDRIFNENMWRVDKEGYDKCEVNTKGDPKVNKFLFACDDKQRVKVADRFYFMKSSGMEDIFSVIFEPGQHYYFISTSNGDSGTALRTRNASGPNGSCVKHHMKLHIYVCNKNEDCVYKLPKCDPPSELYKNMRLINGKLPPVTEPPDLKTTTNVRTARKFVTKVDKQVAKPTTPGGDVGVKMPICKVEEKGTSIHLILNFVLGGVALFMAVVIIILVCGLSDKDKSYEMERPSSAISTTHGGHIVNAEIVRYSDGHIELSPVMYSRTPPTSPSIIIPPYATLQRVHSLRQSAPSDHVPMEDTPPEHSPLETPISNLCSDIVHTFAFPDQAEAEDSETTSEGIETTSDGVDSSESGLTTTAIVTNPRHDHELDT